MAKYRYRIEGGRYGGEAVIGEVNPAFASYYVTRRDELVDAVLDSEDWDPSDEAESDALLDPEGIPHPAIPGEDFYMWENDEFEHIIVLMLMADFLYMKYQQMVQMIGTMKKKHMTEKQFLYMEEKADILVMKSQKLLMKKMKTATNMYQS